MKKVIDNGTCKCGNPNPSNAIELKRCILCPKPEGVPDLYPCILGECETCKDFKNWKVCDCANILGNGEENKFSFEEHGPITYTKKDGTEQLKKDFRPSDQMTMATFITSLKDYFMGFFLHHDLAKWQNAMFDLLCVSLSMTAFLCVLDFAENGTIIVQREQFARYFMKVGFTIFPIVTLVDLRMLADGEFEEGEKADLLAMFAAQNRPPRVKISHLIISDDLTHDDAAVQHYLKKHMDLMESIRKPTEPSWSTSYYFSDGCKAQFKNATMFLYLTLWLEMYAMAVIWCFFCSCHVPPPPPPPSFLPLPPPPPSLPPSLPCFWKFFFLCFLPSSSHARSSLYNFPFSLLRAWGCSPSSHLSISLCFVFVRVMLLKLRRF
jgi:hypothetical protein